MRNLPTVAFGILTAILSLSSEALSAQSLSCLRITYRSQTTEGLEHGLCKSSIHWCNSGDKTDSRFELALDDLQKGSTQYFRHTTQVSGGQTNDWTIVISRKTGEFIETMSVSSRGGNDMIKDVHHGKCSLDTFTPKF